VTNPWHVKDGFPANPQDINIIRPKINLLIGEESKRPRSMRVIQSNDSVVSKLQEVKKAMLLNYVGASLMANSDPQAGQDEDVMDLPQIQNYLSTEYKDIAEATAFHSLNYLYNKLGLDNEFLTCWQDGLIAGKTIAYVGVVNGDPYFERVNPLYFYHDNAPDLEFIEDGDWCVRRM
jgi:hypothetical protein